MNTKTERIKTDLENLAKFNATPGEGLTRFSYTKEHEDARNYIISKMNEAGLKVTEDAIGNIFGKREGSDNSLPSVMIGSHFDSVKNGGIFDGMAGVVAGLEVARTLNENNVQNKYPFEVVAIVEEEGGRFSVPIFGGRVISGMVSSEDLDEIVGIDGVPIKEAMKNFGLKPEEFEKAKRDPKTMKAFMELHIEQGPILENSQKEIGIVEGIVGIAAYEIEVYGRPDHAGTTPMNVRKDALVCASKIIKRIPNIAIEAGHDTVSTVGQITTEPYAINIVPKKVNFAFEVRSLNPDSLKYVVKSIEKELEKECGLAGMTYKITKKVGNPETILSKEICSIFEEKSKGNGYSYMRMPSGAGHDSMFINSIVDTAMIFVPSKDGRSHCKEEWTDYDQINKGTQILFDTVVELTK